MFKKVALYGLAFGSLSASMVLIQYINGLILKPGTFVSAIPILANILLPAFGVFMLIRALSRLKTDKPINMGKALFGALIMCVIVAFCNIAAYQHIFYNKKHIIVDFKNFQNTLITKSYNSDTTLSAADRDEKIKTAVAAVEENMSVSSFGRMELMMCLSTGMVVALLTFLRSNKAPE